MNQADSNNTHDNEQTLAAVQQVAEAADSMRTQLGQVIVGQQEVIERC